MSIRGIYEKNEDNVSLFANYMQIASEEIC